MYVRTYVYMELSLNFMFRVGSLHLTVSFLSSSQLQLLVLQGLKCRLNPSLEEADKRTIECSLYVPPGEDGEGQGKLWLGLVG